MENNEQFVVYRRIGRAVVKAGSYAASEFSYAASRISDDLRRTETFSLSLMAFVLVGLFASLMYVDPAAKLTVAKADAPKEDEKAAPAAANRPDPLKSVTIRAQAAIVWDVAAGKPLYEKNADSVRALASITKVATAVTAAGLMPAGSTVTVSKDFLDAEGDTGLYADERWKLSDLIDFSLVVSSNDGAQAIAAVAGSMSSGIADPSLGREQFIARMNDKAREIGLRSMRFSNETGLDTADGSGGVGSARDVALLMQYALAKYPHLLEATRYDEIRVSSLDNLSHVGENTNDGLDRIPGIIASKTGYTDKSGGNLAVAFDAGLGQPVIIVVLGSTYDGRFEDTITLAKATLGHLNATDNK